MVFQNQWLIDIKQIRNKANFSIFYILSLLAVNIDKHNPSVLPLPPKDANSETKGLLNKLMVFLLRASAIFVIISVICNLVQMHYIPYLMNSKNHNKLATKYNKKIVGNDNPILIMKAPIV